MKALTARCELWLWNAADCPAPLCKQLTGELADQGVKVSTEPTEQARAVLLFLQCDTTDVAWLERCQTYQDEGFLIIVLDVGAVPLPFHRVWQLLGSGVADVLRPSPETATAATIAARLQRRALIDHVLNSDRIRQELIGRSKAWCGLLRQLIEVACFGQSPVLILGESGTGKELVARLIHDLDRRPDKQELVLLDCSTLVPELSGSEFFGHEKGAYTNAVSLREGAFARADRGTLFLDEVGELPLPLQAALLRVVQEGTYKRVGGNSWKKTNFRLVSATNRPLGNEVVQGRFRADLYYRINTSVLRLPRLEERREDILDLAQHFFCHTTGKPACPPLGPYLRDYLLTRSYPGNVRELSQVVTRLANAYTGTGPLTIGHLPEAERTPPLGGPDSWRERGFTTGIRQALANGFGLKEIKKIAGDVALELAVQQAEGHLPTAAQRLSVSERLVQSWWAERKEETVG